MLKSLALILALISPSLLAATNDELHAAAMEQYEIGHYTRAAEILKEPAAANHLRSQEVLALMHWYGDVLFGPGPWSKETALHLLEHAASNGSKIAAAYFNRLRRKNKDHY